MFTTAAATKLIVRNLRDAGLKGSAVTQLGSGLAGGLGNWLPQLQLRSADAGSAGAGIGSGTLSGMNSRILYRNLLLGLQSVKLGGSSSGDLAKGIAGGVSECFSLLIQYQTTHPVVGSGVGTGSIRAPVGPTALNLFVRGLASAGMVGSEVPRLAAAIEQGLRVSAHSLVFSIAIVGTGSPSATTGIGFGKVQ